MQKARSGFGVICVNEIVYFIGGNDGEDILNTVESYSLETG